METEPTNQLPTHSFKFEGKDYQLYKREASKDAPWYFRLQRAGQRLKRSMETNVAENAVVKAKIMIAAGKGERWEEFKEKSSLRQICAVTRSAIYKLYHAYPNRKPATTTRELNINALEEICGTGETLPGKDTAWDWKQKILQKAAVEAGTDDVRHRQLLRSANSRLVQGRSVFTKDLIAYYKRQGKLTLPKSLDDFLKEPKFPSDETGRTDYWPAPDTVIRQTLLQLETLAVEDRNLYVAIWLTLGFGLRKSEIAIAKVSWFQRINDTTYCAGDELAKNNQFPRIRCQLGAWDKIQPKLAGLKPEDFILIGKDGERTDQVFRRCSTWLRKLGWNSQKAIHEFRSYAGCQIAMGDRKGAPDLRAAQEFLRHANITTTENYYMRYLRTELKEVTLQLPTPAAFVPKIVEA